MPPSLNIPLKDLEAELGGVGEGGGYVDFIPKVLR